MTRTESSAMFSLKELLTLEEARIADEEARATKQRAARAAEERARTERAREEEAARLRAADEARAARERREREEAASLEARVLAEVERERILAERRAAEALREKEHEHARAMAVFSESRRVRTWQRTAVLALSGSIVAIAAMLSGYWLRVEPGHSAELRSRDVELAARDAELARVARDREAQRARALELEVRVRELEDRALAVPAAPVADKPKPGARVPAKLPKVETKGEPECHPMDSMCGLKR